MGKAMSSQRESTNTPIVLFETVMEGITSDKGNIVVKHLESNSESSSVEILNDSVHSLDTRYDVIEDDTKSEMEAFPLKAPTKPKLTHEMVKCLEFEEKVDTFKHVIINVLIVREILPYLPFVDHDELRNVDRRSPKEAVVVLLDVIKSYKEIEKWNHFMEVLSKCGYEYIVKTIRGYSFITYHYQAEYLKNLAPTLNKMIQPIVLLSGLLAAEILSHNDREEIETECKHNGKINAADMMLSRIPKKHPKWYTKFIQVLRQDDFHEIADMLDIPNLTKHDVVKHSSINDRPELLLPTSEALSSTDNTLGPSGSIPGRIHQDDTINRKMCSYLSKQIYEESDNTDNLKSSTTNLNSESSFESELEYEEIYEEVCEQIQSDYHNLKETCTGCYPQEKNIREEYCNTYILKESLEELDKQTFRAKLIYIEKKTKQLDEELDLLFNAVESDMINKLLKVRELRCDKNIEQQEADTQNVLLGDSKNQTGVYYRTHRY